MRTHDHTLGERLRALRESRGIGIRALARRIDCSPSWISKIETGRLSPTRAYLRNAMPALRLTRSERATLHALWQLHEIQHGGMESDGRNLTRRQRAIGQLLKHAKVIRCFDAMILAGPLQTSGYAKAIFRKGTPDLDWHRAWRTRVKWTDLWRNPKQEWHFVVHENALRFRVGPPQTMRGQVAYLRRLAKRGRIHILPADLELPVIPPTDFTILDDTLVIIDTAGGVVTIPGKGEIQEYLRLFEALELQYGQPR